MRFTRIGYLAGWEVGEATSDKGEARALVGSDDTDLGDLDLIDGQIGGDETVHRWQRQLRVAVRRAELRGKGSYIERAEGQKLAAGETATHPF